MSELSLPGAKDGKKRRKCAVAALYLPSGCVRGGIWVRWGNLNTPPSFSEPGEVTANVPKPDGLLPHVSSDLAGYPCPSSRILCVFLQLMRELGKASSVLLMLGYSSCESHPEETEPTTPVIEMVAGWSFQLL